MKIKYIIVYAALAVAFAAVSALVFLSGGKNATAVRTKFRIGGLLLTISGLLATSSCNGGGIFTPTCYEPAVPEYVTLSTSADSHDLSVGDSIIVTVKESAYFDSYSYEIVSYGPEQSTILQSGDIAISDAVGQITISPTDYKGDIYLTVFGIEGESKVPVAEGYFRIK